MEYRRFGALVRAVRRRACLRQVDVAVRAGLSQRTVSRVERGECGAIDCDVLDSIAGALGIRLRLDASWQGARGDALVDARHSSLVEQVVRLLRQAGWETRVEYSFSRYGDPGRVDVLGWLAGPRALLIVEVKDELGDLQETLGAVDVKERVVPFTVPRDLGWHPAVVGVALVVPRGSHAWRVVSSRAAVFAAAFPARSRELKRWLANPAAPLRVLAFVSGSHGATVRSNAGAERRVRQARKAPRAALPRPNRA